MVAVSEDWTYLLLRSPPANGAGTSTWWSRSTPTCPSRMLPVQAVQPSRLGCPGLPNKPSSERSRRRQIQLHPTVGLFKSTSALDRTILLEKPQACSRWEQLTGEPDQESVTHLGKDECHRGEASERADVVLADLASSIVDVVDDLRKHDAEAVVDARSQAIVPGSSHISPVLEEMQWQVGLFSSLLKEDFPHGQDDEESQSTDDSCRQDRN